MNSRSIKKSKIKKILISLFPIFFLMITHYLFKFYPSVYYNYLWGHESKYPYAIGEWLQFIFFLSAFIVTLISIFLTKNYNRINNKRFSLIVFAFFSLFIAMEEISWGQNIFGFITPEVIKKVNFQNQITVHNLNPLQSEFSIFSLPFSILHIFFIIFGLILGLFFPYRNKLRNSIIRTFIPTWYLSLYFIIPAIFYLSVSFGVIEWWHQELFETILALGFLLLSIINLQESKNNVRQKY